MVVLPGSRGFEAPVTGTIFKKGNQMKKISTALATMIVMRFVVKTIDRIKHPEELRREYEKAERYRKKLEADRRRRAESNVNVRFESTPRSPEAWLAKIGSVRDLESRYEELAKVPAPMEPCDGAALRASTAMVGHK